MKESNESESSLSCSSPSVPSSSEIILNINEEEFYNLVNAQTSILVLKYTEKQKEYEKMETNELFSNIFKDFYAAQEKLKTCKIEKEKNDNNNINNIIEEDDNNINNESNKNDTISNQGNKDLEMNEIIDALLTEIFFEEPFDKYTKKFYSIIRNISKEYLAQNILEEKKNMTFSEYLEKKIFKTKFPNFVKNLLIMIVLDKENHERERHLMDPEEKKKFDESIKRNERKEKNIKIEDWNLEKVLSLLDTPKEKERLSPILKEMEEDLKPKPSPLSIWRNEDYCKKVFKENKAKFNIIAMNKFYLDMEHITICISGFLTEKQEHFSGWKEFVRNNNQVTFYYFLNWPSESGIGSFMNFNQAKKRANYFGKILSNMVVSEKFFKNKKITLVGHSLGCHFIKCFLKEIAENKDEDFQGLNNKIDKIIFLGGATQIKNNKRWSYIFKQVTKGNVHNFYSKKDGALKVMQTKLVWGKKPIGRNPLLIQGIDVHNYDCGNIEFEDFLNHGYKQIYGKIVEYFNL